MLEVGKLLKHLIGSHCCRAHSFESVGAWERVLTFGRRLAVGRQLRDLFITEEGEVCILKFRSHLEEIMMILSIFKPSINIVPLPQ